MRHSIVIAGAGLVGTSFALSMKDFNISVQILETHLPTVLTTSQNDTRPISLSLGSVRTLTALGVWDELQTAASPILSVHVSEQGKFGVTRFSAHEENVPALGYVVPFAKLQSTLYHAAAAQSNVTITSIESIKSLQKTPNGMTVSTDNVIHTDLFIAADGTHSTCRDLLHIPHTEYDHDDTAHIYQLELTESHQHTAYERFTPYGVLAILPLSDSHRAQLVWTITPRITKKTIDWNDAGLLSFLQNTFEGRLSIHTLKKTAQYPLKTIIADTQVAKHAALLGNAAHTIYPVAAQGFNLGLYGVALLSDVIKEAIQNGQPIGDDAVLKKYSDRVSTHQQQIFKLTDQLTPLFELPLIGHLRGLGLLSLDLIAPLKKTLAKRTMGLTPHLPRFRRKS